MNKESMDKEAVNVGKAFNELGRVLGRAASKADNYVEKGVTSIRDVASPVLEESFIGKQLKNIATSPMGRWAGIFGAGALASQFVEAVIVKLKEMRVEAKSDNYYEKMLQGNPKLMDKDPEEVAVLWSTLYHTAPNLARDPVAAGAFIRQSIDREVLKEYGGPPIDTYKTLIDIEKNKKINSNDSFVSGITSAFIKSLSNITEPS